MSEDSLNLTLSGELAAAVRSTAEAAGLSAQEWMQQVVRERLERGTEPSSKAPSYSAQGLGSPDAWEEVSDPRGLFTVPLPRGWHHQATVAQGPGGQVSTFTTTSPDGATTIHGNDPQEGLRMPGFGSLLRGEDKSAAGFGGAYLTKHYGKLPGFRVTGSAPLPELGQAVQQGLVARQIQPSFVDAAYVRAEFVRDSTPMTLAAVVSTVGLGMGWVPQVMHIVSSGDAAGFVPACLHINAAMKLTSQGEQAAHVERVQRQQQHEATMANIAANSAAMTAAHNQRMRNMSAQNAAFQQSLAERQQTFDAGVQSWRQQQAASDASHSSYMSGLREAPTYGAGGGGPDDHRNFLNMIKEQETVVDRSGWEHQVEAGPDKYYYNEYQERFIGLENHQDIHDVPGINPDDWYETPIQR
ncbi:hypothetical protein [Aestuariimicrobium sp. Y1814]|uniref:hypothetical protein n=1 Tax=Aestuariimicrobium sp. Y1814 TaxID=3418742 RepID=UPI003DA77F67